jgi:hypothetical protein
MGVATLPAETFGTVTHYLQKKCTTLPAEKVGVVTQYLQKQL